MYRLVLCILYLTLFINSIENARILAFLPTPSLSHNIVYHPVVKELSLRGHQVVSVLPDLINDPTLVNLTEIDTHDLAYEIWRRRNKFTEEKMNKITPMASLYGMSQALVEMSDKLLDMPEMKKIIQDKNEHFDLVINEWLLFPSTFTLGHHFNCPSVGISSFGLFLHGHDSIGNPAHPAISPDFYLPFITPMNFWNRVYSTFYVIWYRLYFYNILLPQHDEIARRHFGDHIPYVGDILTRVSVILMAESAVYAGPRANVPTVIEISGIHMKPIKPLPYDLQNFLDNSPEGVIYLSLGTNVYSTSLPMDGINELIEAFRVLPYKILWKWENDTMPNKPSNVYIRKWFPQQDLFEHPNLKLFIMQGGLQSTEEAIRAKLPMIAIPFFADQEQNAARHEKHGIGRRLSLNELKREYIVELINDVITNSRYKERITELSKVMWDQPQTPLERAVWWIEYVLRHKGANALKSLAVEMPWYQYHLLDVFAFFAVLIFVVLFIIVLCIKILCNFFLGCKKIKKD